MTLANISVIQDLLTSSEKHLWNGWLKKVREALFPTEIVVEDSHNDSNSKSLEQDFHLMKLCNSYNHQPSLTLGCSHHWHKKQVTAWKVSIFGVILVRIQSKCGKIRTRITPNIDNFYAVSNALSVTQKRAIRMIKNGHFLQLLLKKTHFLLKSTKSKVILFTCYISPEVATGGFLYKKVFL